MVLSRRERMILIAAVVAVVMLVADKFVVRPISAQREEVKTRKLQLKTQLDSAQILFTRRRLMERQWKTSLTKELRDDAEAESTIARALDGWSKDARLTLSSVKPERVASDKGLKEMTFVVAGTGALEAVARFLWQIETSKLPIKVKDMQLGSTNESGQNMSLQLRLSALCLGTEREPSEKQQPQEPQQQEQQPQEQQPQEQEQPQQQPKEQLEEQGQEVSNEGQL